MALNAAGFERYCELLIAELGRPLQTGDLARARNAYSLGLSAEGLAALIRRGGTRDQGRAGGWARRQLRGR